MPRKLLIARLGAGTLTVALCAALPGCNLGVLSIPNDCVGTPSSRGMSSVVCPAEDAATDAPPDSPRDTTSTADHP